MRQPSRVDAVVAFLASTDPSASCHVPGCVEGESILGVAMNTRAVRGEMSWVSTRRLGQFPEDIVTFNGSLLITPPLVERVDPQHAVVSCENPKLAFSLAVERFLPELPQVRWPAHGAQVHAGARVDESAVLGPGAVIGSGTSIGAETEVGPNTVIANATIGGRVRVGANCSIGLPGFGYERDTHGHYIRFPHVGRVVIEDDVEVGSNTCIDRGALGDTWIGAHSKIDNLVHIAHNVEIGRNAVIVAHAMIGGSVVIGDDVWCAPAALIRNQLRIEAGAVVGMGAVVVRAVGAGETVVGNPARVLDPDRGR